MSRGSEWLDIAEELNNLKVNYRGMEREKQEELLNDVKGECGCYVLGDYCYDKEGNPTHAVGEECVD